MSEECNYTKDETKELPYPREAYVSECGFQLAIMEGYEFESHKDTGGTPFSTRSNKLALPSGKCMKCGKRINPGEKG